MDLKIQQLEYAPGAFLEYTVQDSVVVYCGTTDIRELPEQSSTTNAAGDILAVLAKVIGRPVHKLMFFELATHTSWVLQPGEYDFQRVILTYGRLKQAVAWTRIAAPEAILQAFRHRIGGDALQRYAPDPKEAVDASVIEA